MFHKKKGPDEPFAHADDCKIVHADPDVQIPWSEIRRGVWEARCVCGVQYHHDPITDDRVRNDPLKIGHRGAPQCELHGETDPGVLRLALKAVKGTAIGGCSAVPVTPDGRFPTTPRASGDDELASGPIRV